MQEHSQPQSVIPFPPKNALRLYGLDWLRVGATLAVVLLHAGIPYMTNTLPGLVWASYSPVRSDFIDLLGWAINGCIMPLFFIMSGYLACQLFKKHGANEFLKHRFKRLGGPLLFGMVFVLPLSSYVWMTGWITAGLAPFDCYRTLKVEQSLEDAVLGPAHLWYIVALLVFCCVMWGLSRFTSKLSQKMSPGKAGVGLLAGVGCMSTCLFFYPEIVIGFRNSIFPYPTTLLYYMVPFSAGWFWSLFPLQPQAIPHLKWYGLCGCAGALFLILWPQLINHLEAETSTVTNAAVPILFVLYGMTMACGCFGLALNWAAPTPPEAIRYCAKASLWVYLFHHPVVALTQLSFASLNIPVEAKFVLVTSVTTFLCLLSYEVLGRRTWAATVLSGRKELPVQANKIELPSTEKRRAA